MSTSTTPTTFSDLITAVLNAVRGSTTASGADETIAKRLLNQGLSDLHVQEPWPWSERRDIILTHGDYATGSLSIASTARTAMEGTNTLWTTAVSGMGFNNTRVGGKIQIGSESDVYVVSAVGSATSITLETRYTGQQDVASAYAVAYGTYSYFEDEYALASDFWRLIDTRSFSDSIDIEILGRAEFHRTYPRNDTPGKPQQCTIIELGPSGSVALRPRVVFHPPPDTVYTIPYRYVTNNLAVSTTGTGATDLSASGDEPIIPLRYRHVLVYYAIREWYRDRKDDARSQEANAEYTDLVKRMKNDSFPEKDTPRLRPMRRPYLAGVAGPYRSRGTRYTANPDRWDQLR
jgi:hypothetical protein